MTLFPTPDALLAASEIELERALLRHVLDVMQDPMRRMATRDGIVNELFSLGGYDYAKKVPVQKAISRAWKALEADDLIEEPDPDNGRNGYRVVSPKGRRASAEVDFGAARVRARFTRAMFHASLPDAAWNAFRAGDYDTAVFEAFKALEVAVRTKGKFPDTDFGKTLMTKAFDPQSGPLRDKAAPLGRRQARQSLFEGVLGELRNPKAHRDPTITDPLIAVEEMMVAGTLWRIVDGA